MKPLFLDTTKVGVYPNTNDDGVDHISLMFTTWAIEYSQTVYINNVTLHNIAVNDKSIEEFFVTKFNAQKIMQKTNSYGVYHVTYAWANGYCKLTANGNPDDDYIKDVDDIEREYVYVTAAITNYEESVILRKGLLAFDKPATTNGGKIYVLCTSGNSLTVQSIGMAAQSIEPANYNDDVISDYNYVIRQLQEPQPSGRIVLLDGQAGTGKTFLTRAMLHDASKCTFLIIPSNMVDSLGQPTFMEVFLKYRYILLSPIVIIIEDADRCLAPRAADNISVISTLLNMTDGIIGRQLDLRILATTNASIEDIDPAIMRPGRLLTRTHVGALTVDKANAVYKRLTGKEGPYESEQTLAQVYYDAKETEKHLHNEKKPIRRMGFGS